MRYWSLVMSGLISLLLVGCSSSSPVEQPPEPQVSVEDLKANATTPDYDDLARTPEQFVGTALTFVGEVIQVAGSEPRQVLRVNVTEGEYLWKDTVWVNVKAEGVRVLEKDIVQLWGTGAGERVYTAVLGNEVRVPQVDAYAIEVVVKAGDR